MLVQLFYQLHCISWGCQPNDFLQLIILLCWQGLAIFAFCDRIINARNMKYILSVGPTFVLMKFFQCKLWWMTSFMLLSAHQVVFWKDDHIVKLLPGHQFWNEFLCNWDIFNDTLRSTGTTQWTSILINLHHVVNLVGTVTLHWLWSGCSYFGRYTDGWRIQKHESSQCFKNANSLLLVCHSLNSNCYSICVSNVARTQKLGGLGPD